MATLSRDSLCNIGAVQIPRPKCAGFQFVPTRGRMGFYRSIKRDGHKYGIEMKNERGPRRPQLPDAGFWAPPSADQIIHETNNNNINEKQHHPQQQQQQHLQQNQQHSPSEQSFSDLSSDSGSTKFSIAPLKKTPPPAPPLPIDAARLPPRPPRGGVPIFKKQFAPIQQPQQNVIVEKKEEPPVDYDINEDDKKQQNFRRQAPVTSKVYRQTPTEYEVNNQNRKYSVSSSSTSSGSKYSERF
jgi:hypothetical protein|uniref:Uncharacterized protein n=1 Tax=Panagrolaimus sp. PS1159 TaxID=55785 RepID=A0AC35FQM8_9BILA